MSYAPFIKRVVNGGTNSIKSQRSQMGYIGRFNDRHGRPQVTLYDSRLIDIVDLDQAVIPRNDARAYVREMFEQSGRLPPGNRNAVLDHDLTWHFVRSFPDGTDLNRALHSALDFAYQQFSVGYFNNQTGRWERYHWHAGFHHHGDEARHPHLHIVVWRTPIGGGPLLVLDENHRHWSYQAMRITALERDMEHELVPNALSRAQRLQTRAALPPDQYEQYLQTLVGGAVGADPLLHIDHDYDQHHHAPGPAEGPGNRSAEDLQRGCTPVPAAENGRDGGDDEDRGGGGDGFQAQPLEVAHGDVNMDGADGAGAPAPQPEPGQDAGVRPQGQAPQNRNQIDVGFEPLADEAGSQSHRRPAAPRNAAQRNPGADADADRPALTAESLRQLERSRDRTQAEQRRDTERWIRRHGREMEVNDENGDNRRRKTPERPLDDARRERDARRQADQASRARAAHDDDDLPHREAGANRSASQRPAAQQAAPPTPFQQAAEALQAARAAARDHRATPRGAGAAADAWRRRERHLNEAVRRARIEYTTERVGQPNVVTRGREQREAEQNRPRPNVTTRARATAQEQLQNRTSGADERGRPVSGGTRSNEPRSS